MDSGKEYLRLGMHSRSSLVSNASTEVTSKLLQSIMSRKTLFQVKHGVEFGLQPVQRSVQGTITTVQCLFCVHIGREKRDGADVKRQRTKNTQLFQFPFRLEAYKNHLESQHSEDWNSYQLLSYQEKVSFFKTRDISGIHRYLDTDKYTLQFVISQSPIVDVVVGNLFFHPEEDEEDDVFQPITKANAMKLF